jgi:hypothetical protein
LNRDAMDRDTERIVKSWAQMESIPSTLEEARLQYWPWEERLWKKLLAKQCCRDDVSSTVLSTGVRPSRSCSCNHIDGRGLLVHFQAGGQQYVTAIHSLETAKEGGVRNCPLKVVSFVPIGDDRCSYILQRWTSCDSEPGCFDSQVSTRGLGICSCMQQWQGGVGAYDRPYVSSYSNNSHSLPNPRTRPQNYLSLAGLPPRRHSAEN